MNTNHLKSLSAAILRLLRPLVRILLRNGVSYGTFNDLARWMYVDVAMKEFSIDGRKQSTSRVSVLTGLSRKEVKRMQEISRPEDTEHDERYNRAARVIAAWRREREFLDADDKPSALPISGPGSTFSEIVRRFSGDVPVRAILDELLRVGAVKRLDNGKISLRKKAYIPEGSEADKLHILGTDVGHLISTIDYNLQPSAMKARFQRKVAYDNLPDEALPAFRKLSTKQAQKLLEKMDEWLAGNDRDVSPSIKGTGRNIAGLGIYYFEEPYPVKEDKNEN
ncbi:MAG: hypothetical protein JRI64_07135 [Deltaproteobacteria bacterium]|nr:hypothetical protein [Deltaproteobacteria bacterium]